MPGIVPWPHRRSGGSVREHKGTDTYKDVLAGKCSFGEDRIGGAPITPPTLRAWYPDRLRIEQLHRNGARSNPLRDQDYKAAFEVIDLNALKAEIKAFLTSSVARWPSDYGNYGPQISAWRGIRRVRTASPTGALARARGCSASPRSTAGGTMAHR